MCGAFEAPLKVVYRLAFNGTKSQNAIYWLPLKDATLSAHLSKDTRVIYIPSIFLYYSLPLTKSASGVLIRFF
jgi:hypothetical protein